MPLHVLSLIFLFYFSLNAVDFRVRKNGFLFLIREIAKVGVYSWPCIRRRVIDPTRHQGGFEARGMLAKHRRTHRSPRCRSINYPLGLSKIFLLSNFQSPQSIIILLTVKICDINMKKIISKIHDYELTNKLVTNSMGRAKVQLLVLLFSLPRRTHKWKITKLTTAHRTPNRVNS